LGNPVQLMLSPGQASDLICAEPLLENFDPVALIGDKAYDADAFVKALADRQITPVIPSHPRRAIPLPCDFALYLRAQPRRALLQQTQALSRYRNTLRQARQKFSRWRPPSRPLSCSTEDRL
jgi:transposase